jgi:hypothetical protein
MDCHHTRIQHSRGKIELVLFGRSNLHDEEWEVVIILDKEGANTSKKRVTVAKEVA